jgi:hypothetical protein
VRREGAGLMIGESHAEDIATLTGGKAITEDPESS